jgi:hypothetical protein
MTNFEAATNDEGFDLEAEFKRYEGLHDNDLMGCIEIGIPLYKQLKKNR